MMPDVAKGSWDAWPTGDAKIVPLGKFGGALRLPEKSGVSYIANDGNLNPACGTISLWIKTDWDGKKNITESLFTFQGNLSNQLRVGKTRTNRLGVAICGGPGNKLICKQADEDISDWQPDIWYHIAATWCKGKLQFYIDGQPTGSPVSGVISPQGEILEFKLTGSGIMVDELRIAGFVRSAEMIKKEALAASQNSHYTYLSDSLPYKSKTEFGKVGFDCRFREDGMSLPLILDGFIYRRGIGIRAPASITFPMNDRFLKFVAKIGVDDLAAEKASVIFRVLVDGREVFKSDRFEKNTPPRLIEVPIAGAKKIELIVDDCGDGNHEDYANWGNAVLIRKRVGGFSIFKKKVSRKMLKTYQKRFDAYRFKFDLPKTTKKYLVASKNYIEEIDPSTLPLSFGIKTPLSTFATPGEYEPLSFVIYTAKDIKNVRVEPTDLKSTRGSIANDFIDVRWIQRSLYREFYKSPPEQSDVVSRFLVKRLGMNLRAHTFQEMHITIHTPENATAGVYSGKIKISGENCRSTNVPISFEILPFKLNPLKRKKYGVYYRMDEGRQVPGRVELELNDIREHGASILHPRTGVRYKMVNGELRPRYDTLRENLSLLRKFGFNGPIPIRDGLVKLARHPNIENFSVINSANRETSKRGQTFQSIAKEGLQGLLKVQQEFPEFELLPTHMDEVINRKKLPLFIRLAQAVRQVPELRIYATIHNYPQPSTRKMMKRLTPYIDVRSYNGHMMDEWIKAGNSFDELALELKTQNNDAWLYYNIRGSFFLAKWMRIINGFYMWVGPFNAHCLWIYHHFKANPLDDIDWLRYKGHDFGLAVPDPIDGKTPIPTRHWECYREGIDDMRYIGMLEDLIAASKDIAPNESSEAQDWIDSLRDIFPKTEDISDINLESPLLVAFSNKISGAKFQRLRRTTADHIMKLLAVKKLPINNN